LKCPKCLTELSDKIIARYLASKGGAKSKRVITAEQQIKMQEARSKKG